MLQFLQATCLAIQCDLSAQCGGEKCRKEVALSRGRASLPFGVVHSQLHGSVFCYALKGLEEKDMCLTYAYWVVVEGVWAGLAVSPWVPWLFMSPRPSASSEQDPGQAVFPGGGGQSWGLCAHG